MDINTTSLFAQQQGLSQLQANASMLKNAAKSEQKTAAILAEAIEGASASGSSTRGTQLDITV